MKDTIKITPFKCLPTPDRIEAINPDSLLDAFEVSDNAVEDDFKAISRYFDDLLI